MIELLSPVQHGSHSWYYIYRIFDNEIWMKFAPEFKWKRLDLNVDHILSRWTPVLDIRSRH